MRRLNQNGLSLVIVLVFAAVLCVGFAAWQVLKHNASRSETMATVPAAQNVDCASDRQCFYQAFVDGCALDSIQIVQKTDEGDPITTTAKIIQDPMGCVVEVTFDGSQDRFGDRKIYTYTCKKLTPQNQELIASECTSNAQSTSVII